MFASYNATHGDVHRKSYLTPVDLRRLLTALKSRLWCQFAQNGHKFACPATLLRRYRNWPRRSSPALASHDQATWKKPQCLPPMASCRLAEAAQAGCRRHTLHALARLGLQ